jgi:hypothetical protein
MTADIDGLAPGQLAYLAAPYSHPDPAVRQARYEEINRAAVGLIKRNVLVFSPITHCHPLHLLGNLPGDFAYWETFDRRMMAACDLLIVLAIPGWEQSVGVKAEIKIAAVLKLPVVMLPVEE